MTALGLKVDSLKRANKFLTEAANTNKVYYLKNGKYVECSESNDFRDEEGNSSPIIPFWSQSFIPYARKWSERLEVKELSFDDFKSHWLTGMSEDGVVVGLNCGQNGINYECTPIYLLEKISQNY